MFQIIFFFFHFFFVAIASTCFLLFNPLLSIAFLLLHILLTFLPKFIEICMLVLCGCIEFMTWSEIVYKQQLKTLNWTILTIDGKQITEKNAALLRTCNVLEAMYTLHRQEKMWWLWSHWAPTILSTSEWVTLKLKTEIIKLWPHIADRFVIYRGNMTLEKKKNRLDSQCSNV